MLGTELAAAGRHEDALVQLRAAAADAQLPRARYHLGVELFNAGDLDGARRELQQFVSEQPALLEVIPARALIGRTFAAQSRWPEAIAAFEDVLQKAPTNGAARELLVSALGNQAAAEAAVGRLDAALPLFRRAADLAPNDAAVNRNYATALFDARNADAALAPAERAVSLAPNDAAAHNLLGKITAVRGDLPRAQAELARAIELAPADAQFKEDQARLRAAIAAR